MSPREFVPCISLRTNIADVFARGQRAGLVLRH